MQTTSHEGSDTIGNSVVTTGSNAGTRSPAEEHAGARQPIANQWGCSAQDVTTGKKLLPKSAARRPRLSTLNVTTSNVNMTTRATGMDGST
jgi:hypothetical protein